MFKFIKSLTLTIILLLLLCTFGAYSIEKKINKDHDVTCKKVQVIKYIVLDAGKEVSPKTELNYQAPIFDNKTIQFIVGRAPPMLLSNVFYKSAISRSIEMSLIINKHRYRQKTFYI
jgi:hypothetical protein